MTKAEIKLLCEDDDQLNWWAMVLFAEISEYWDYIEKNYSRLDGQAATFTDIVSGKVKEFEKLVIQRAKEKAKEGTAARNALCHRVEDLERRVKSLEDMAVRKVIDELEDANAKQQGLDPARHEES